MSQSPVVPVRDSRTTAQVRLGERAVTALTTELTRHSGPKHGLLVGARAGSLVLTVAIESLLPDDRLTVVAAPGAAEAISSHVDGRGAWVAERVRVTETLAEADAADVVIVAEPVTGSAEAARALLDD